MTDTCSLIYIPTETSRKVSGILMYINRIQDSLSKEARLIAVQTLALSHLSYAIAVWGTANTKQLKRVQKLQSFAARVAIGGVSKFETQLLFYKNCSGCQ